MGKNTEREQMEALDTFIDQALIEEVLGVIKSGKEATVYSCLTPSGEIVAAKVYRTGKVRQFANDAPYRSDRLRGREHRREARAMRGKTAVGRQMAFSGWVGHEHAALEKLHAAGVDVPRPIARSDAAILMEYVTDGDGPAPPLTGIDLTAPEARAIFDRLNWNIEVMLAEDRVHGDLSPYNVLYAAGRIVIIDFPQSVDARFNPNALTLLERDLDNMCRWAARYDIEADAAALARRLWRRFLRSDL